MEKLNLNQITQKITKIVADGIMDGINEQMKSVLADKITSDILETSECSHREYQYDENAEQLQDSYHYISSYTHKGDDNTPTITVDTHWLIDIKDLDGREDISDCKSWRITHYTMDIA